ncbi:hypothetical protein BASA61_008613 [Batrachochytrium salamandrivorans]|nr:hypothetical protein BASA60_003526 [Batrachochytrium salamandrivorans]KAH6582209.1 hypothetical protein BASA61_008613 [Batrachochytrium salamandrivorans]
MLEDIEQACAHSLGSPDAATRQFGQTALSSIFPALPSSSSRDGSVLPLVIQRCILVLEQSNQSYAILWIGGYLKKLISHHTSQISLADLVNINNCMTIRLLQQPFSSSRASVSTFCCISAAVTVLGWGRSETAFSQSLFPSDKNVEYQATWVILLRYVILEMNPEKSILKGFPKHRKNAISFRDSHLHTVFQKASQMLKDIPKLSDDSFSQKIEFVSDLVLLICECLAFDFIGINPDESTDDQGSIHIPSTWKSDILDQDLIRTLCNFLVGFPSCQIQILDCMAYIFCSRRSLFSDSERDEVTIFKLQILIDILNLSERLTDDGQQRAFRLIARFISVYSSDIIKSVDAERFFHELSKKTLSYISVWNDASMIHILQAWQKLADSCGNLKSEFSIKYRPYLNLVACGLIRFNGDNLDIAHDAENLLNYILEPCSAIIRFDYSSNADIANQRFQDSVSTYLEADGLTTEEDSQSCAWSTIVIAAVIGGRTPYQSPEEHDGYDGKLAALLFQLATMDVINTTNQGRLFSDALELSLLHFILQFKKSYLCDNGSRRSTIFDSMAHLCGIASQEEATISLFNKLLVNLRFSSSAAVLEKTIEAFTEYTSGSTTSKILKKSNIALVLAESHSSDHFACITDPKLIQQFYAGITRLLILETDDSFDKELGVYLAPFQNELEQYTSMGDNELIQQEVRIFTSRLFRKLSIPCLRFLQEFVLNKSGRLNFDVNSASGLIIFREVSEAVMDVGYSLMKNDISSIPESQIWARGLKHISILLGILKNLFGGRYVCFGVFSLYNDPVFANTTSVMFGLSRYVEARYLLEFHKLGAAFLGACSIIDNIFSHVCLRHIRGKTPDVLFVCVQQSASQSQEILAALFDKVINEELQNQWSMTRPLLPLVLLFSEYFQTYVEEQITTQRPQIQESFRKEMTTIMKDVTLSLETKNRDCFTSNISSIRRRITFELSSPV